MKTATANRATAKESGGTMMESGTRARDRSSERSADHSDNRSSTGRFQQKRPATEDDIVDSLDDAIALAEIDPTSGHPVKQAVLERVSQRAAHRSGEMVAVRLTPAADLRR